MALQLGHRSGLTRQGRNWHFHTIFSDTIRSVKESNRGLLASVLEDYLSPPIITPRRLVSETLFFRLPFTMHNAHLSYLQLKQQKPWSLSLSTGSEGSGGEPQYIPGHFPVPSARRCRVFRALQRIISLFLLSTTASSRCVDNDDADSARETHTQELPRERSQQQVNAVRVLDGILPCSDYHTARKQRCEHCFCFLVPCGVLLLMPLLCGQDASRSTIRSISRPPTMHRYPYACLSPTAVSPCDVVGWSCEQRGTTRTSMLSPSTTPSCPRIT